MLVCQLCSSEEENSIRGADTRVYHKCNNCSLISADYSHHLSMEQEKERYLKHINSLEDPNYINFLLNAVNPALPFLNKQMKGLDFGCGPVTAINHILKQHSISCDSYDPVFPHGTPLPPYDFIFSTEVFEHFFYPRKELKKLSMMLKEEGFLIIMTEFHPGENHFKDWYYPRDPTHVVFYNLDTFNYICKEFQFQIVFTDNKRVVILKKKALIK